MNDAYKVVYSPEALDDIKKIYSYIAYELQVPDTELNQVNRIRKEIRSLDFMPMRYAIVDWEPWKSMEMHKVPVDNYIYYFLHCCHQHYDCNHHSYCLRRSGYRRQCQIRIKAYTKLPCTITVMTHGSFSLSIK